VRRFFCDLVKLGFEVEVSFHFKSRGVFADVGFDIVEPGIFGQSVPN